MNNKAFNWFIFVSLSLVWGSSFILMKEGLVALTAYQVASIRIIASGLVLLPFALKNISKIPANKISLIFLSGILGSFLPAYLFCIAEAGVNGIDSALAGTLNALTPVFVLIIGAIFFGSNARGNKLIGIFISLTGSVLLYLSQPNVAQVGNAINVLLCVLATILYGVNVNMVGKYLKDIPSLHIASVALVFISIPAAIVLYFTGFFNEAFYSKPIIASVIYASILGILGTAAASIFFYMLLKRAGATFASMVTYAIPAVAIGWGIIYGEKVGWQQVVCLAIILSGVFIANRNFSKLVPIFRDDNNDYKAHKEDLK